MKTNYLQRNKRRSNKKYFVTGVLVFIFGAIAFSLLDGALVAAVSPVWKAENAVTKRVKNSFSFLRAKSSLIAENESLKLRVAELEAANLNGRAALEREERLFETLGRLPSDSILAGVLSRPPQTAYDVLIADAGEADGVSAGQVVFVPQGGIIGEVEEVFRDNSKIKLYTSSGEKVNAVLERGDIPVIMEGNGGGNFKIILPREITAEPGDRVLSPYFSGELIAVIESVTVKPTDSFKEVLAGAPANMQMIRFVNIRP